MSNIPSFAKYAAAFEQAYASDDWSLVAPFFTEDAVYEVKLAPPFGGVFRGRDAILAYFKSILDRFDRRFASREVGLVSGPHEVDDSVSLRGRARYTASGAPDLEFELDETAWFSGDRIRRLEDRYDAANTAALDAYLRAHGRKLGMDAG